MDRLRGGLVGPGGLLPLDLSRLHEGEGLGSATAWSAQSCCVPVRRVTEDNAGLLCAPAPPFSRTGWSLGGELNATVHSKHSVQGLDIVSGCKDELLFFCASWMTETPWCVWGTFSRLTCSAAGGWPPELAKVENCEN